MKNTKLMLVLLCLMPGTLIAQQPTAAPPQHVVVTSLMSKDLTDIPGKECLMIIVEYPPGSVDPIHRHNAHAFVYVLEGSIVMQVKGGKEVTLTPGQTFYEGPDDVHLVGRNASSTKPAKFLVLLVKNKGAPVLVPVPEGMSQQKPRGAAQRDSEYVSKITRPDLGRQAKRSHT